MSWMARAHRQDRLCYGIQGDRRRGWLQGVHQASMITSWAMPVSMV